MKRIVQKIKSYSKSIELSEGDKDDLRARLISFMKEHPIEQKTSSSIKSPYWAFFRAVKNPFTIGALAMIFAFSGITSAAEKALPGDMLYPIKVYINEGIYQAFTFNNTAEAAWHTERAERRFEEIERLIARGELDEHKLTIIEAYLDQALKDAEISSDPTQFSAILEAHASILAKMDREGMLDKSKVNTSINETREVVTKKKYQQSATNNQNVVYAPNYITATEKKNIAKKRFDEVSKELSNLEIDTTTRTYTEEKIAAALDAYTKGSSALKASDYTRARDQFILSISLMQEAKLIATVPAFLGLEDSASSSITSDTSVNQTTVAQEKVEDEHTEKQENDDTAEENNNDKKENNEVREKDSNNAVEETKEKVKEVQDDIQESVKDLLP